MPLQVPGYIRYFCYTDTSSIGQAALEYLRALIRIAPVRIVTLSGGGLQGPWRAFENLLLTPMTGTCVSCVCTSPSRWVWTSSVPMTKRDLFAESGGAVVLKSTEQLTHDDTYETISPFDEVAEISAFDEVAERVEELYTPKLRNVLFMTHPPQTEQQVVAAQKYEDVIAPSLSVAQSFVARWPDRRFQAGIVPVPVTDHARIREAIVGTP